MAAIIPGTPRDETINAVVLRDFIVGDVGPMLEIAGSLTFAASNPTLGLQSGTLRIDAAHLQARACSAAGRRAAASG